MSKRKGLEKDIKDDILKCLNEEENSLKNLERISLGQIFKQTIMTDMKVKEFVDKLKFKIKQRKATLDKIEEERVQKEVLAINKSDMLFLEESVLVADGNFMIGLSNLTKIPTNASQHFKKILGS